MPATVIVSGGFDPLHVGHVKMLEWAARAGNVVAVLDSDEWVSRKHPVLLPVAERATVLRSLRCVSDAVVCRPEDSDCSRPIRFLRNCFHSDVLLYVVGPDHADMRFPEKAVCDELGIPVIVYPGEKTVGSSDILSDWRRRAGPDYDNPAPTADAILIFDGRVVVLDRGGEISLPGGFVEPGETAVQAAARELREETGLQAALTTAVVVGSFCGTYIDGRPVLSTVVMFREYQAYPADPTEGSLTWVNPLTYVPKRFKTDVDEQIYCWLRENPDWFTRSWS